MNDLQTICTVAGLVIRTRRTPHGVTWEAVGPAGAVPFPSYAKAHDYAMGRY